MHKGLGSLCGAVALGSLFVVPAAPVWAQDMIARGQYLMDAIVGCDDCHTPIDAKGQPIEDKAYAGGFRFGGPAFTAYSSNITPDKETGIGGWTDKEIVDAIREGRTPDGSVIGPPMPIHTYHGMADADVEALVAYLRTVEPIANAVPASDYKMPLEPLPPVEGVTAPDPSDQVAYGGYIANALAHCFECHTTPDDHGVPDMAHMMGAGGMPIELGPDQTVMSPNITPDPETGIGKWSDAEIKTAITKGVDPHGRKLLPPMPYSHFAKMTDADLDAIVAYLRTIPPIENAVPEMSD